ENHPDNAPICEWWLITISIVPIIDVVNFTFSILASGSLNIVQEESHVNALVGTLTAIFDITMMDQGESDDEQHESFESMRIPVNSIVHSPRTYGVYRDFNADVYTYVAAVDVDEDAPLPDGWVAVEIPAHDFAVYDHGGPLATIGDHWNAIATSGQVTHDYSVPSLEVYPPDFKEGHALTLWLPIVTSAT
ncbi:hypothetical protein DYB28_014325, partial [Aphanomyces astaci]